MATISKPELIEKVCGSVKEGDIASKAAADRIVNAVFKTIVDEVAAGNEVTIVGFGTFKKSDKAATTRKNPLNGEVVSVPAKTVPKFKAGKAFKDAVAK